MTFRMEWQKVWDAGFRFCAKYSVKCAAKIVPEMRGCELEMWYGNRKDTVEKAEEEGAKIVPEKWGCEFE